MVTQERINSQKELNSIVCEYYGVARASDITDTLTLGTLVLYWDQEAQDLIDQGA